MTTLRLVVLAVAVVFVSSAIACVASPDEATSLATAEEFARGLARQDVEALSALLDRDLTAEDARLMALRALGQESVIESLTVEVSEPNAAGRALEYLIEIRSSELTAGYVSIGVGVERRGRRDVVTSWGPVNDIPGDSE